MLTDNPSDIISMIVRCDVSVFNIGVNIISMKELKFLTKSGNVDTLEIYKQIYLSDGTKIPPEDLIALVPKATYIL
uniref:Uncharacterized protein n=1 Tax=Panagrolaimus sp. ES5 TaxID=591445 RepID=A0AC34FLK9_9BILA